MTTEMINFIASHWLELLGFITGVIYLWLEWKADSRLWLVSIIMPAISMCLYYEKGIYADFAINIYYLVIAVYGYIAWTWHVGKKKNRQLPVSRTPAVAYPMLIIAFAAIWALLWWLLGFTNSTVRVADAFTTALSIVAMVMLARKWAEQWLAWLVVDAVCVWLYIYKGIYFYATLYAVYTVIAAFGYRKWLRMIPSK